MVAPRRLAIPPATADIAVRLGLTLTVRGPLRPHAAALDALWRTLTGGGFGFKLNTWRTLAEPQRRRLAGPYRDAPLADLLDLRLPSMHCRGIECAQHPDPQAAGCLLRLVDMAPLRGIERASSLHFMWGEEVDARHVAALACWLGDALPLWWGTAGFFFERVDGNSYTAYRKIAALAKRYWCIRLHDEGLLHRDALAGLPDIGWITLLGDDFTAAKAFDAAALSIAFADARHDIHVRRARHATLIAAGAAPIKGDVHADENLLPSALLRGRLAPLMLARQPQLLGPHLDEAVGQAWLQRFAEPAAWQRVAIVDG